MSTPLSVFIGIAIVILASGLVKVLHTWAARPPVAAAAGDEALLARLAEVEARLRDVLDVMLAISEKMDRWERDLAGPGRRGASV